MEEPHHASLEVVERLWGKPDAQPLFSQEILAREGLSALKDSLEREYIINHFRRLEGDVDALCRFLNLNRKQLYRSCARLGIHLRAERKKGGFREGKRQN